MIELALREDGDTREDAELCELAKRLKVEFDLERTHPAESTIAEGARIRGAALAERIKAAASDHSGRLRSQGVRGTVGPRRPAQG